MHDASADPEWLVKGFKVFSPSPFGCTGKLNIEVELEDIMPVSNTLVRTSRGETVDSLNKI